VAIEKLQRDGVTILLTAIQPQPMRVLTQSGLMDKIGAENCCTHLDEALARCRELLTQQAG
jgi:anti-anti-sigma regulatory factor